ncbi:DUF2742 domain-containing protein [Mycobacterium koreense]|uniref:Uncharacterized protein n=1 Tax=Mycolicibacillus koreensis TaxID=1069220 RepID=A0A7I7S9R3_9MYCO|nr:DUF2742 domain-containing protein [Mycolicibacillus koreensis]MCV7249849.1 DUF2742 domain-containing protein [Mycolicibacillus koreensis]OSC25104.1 hypothetical protein B8W67_19205 [Mycolicibacillus koreensis]BBY52946.1 hypothetical protein MKOR_01970 [Mycolicibacillus koreensis]
MIAPQRGGPPKEEAGPATGPATSTNINRGTQSSERLASRQVSWWFVHEFVEAAVAQANCGPIPTAGTPSWCELSDGDPRKLLAVAVAGEHHALRVEVAQAAAAEASSAVSAAADWPKVAREIQQRRGSGRIEREGVSR